MDEVIDSVQTSNITEDNKLVKCAVSYYPIVRNKRNKKQEEEPFWKRRIESNINALRKDV